MSWVQSTHSRYSPVSQSRSSISDRISELEGSNRSPKPAATRTAPTKSTSVSRRASQTQEPIPDVKVESKVKAEDTKMTTHARDQHHPVPVAQTTITTSSVPAVGTTGTGSTTSGTTGSTTTGSTTTGSATSGPGTTLPSTQSVLNTAQDKAKDVKDQTTIAVQQAKAAGQEMLSQASSSMPSTDIAKSKAQQTVYQAKSKLQQTFGKASQSPMTSIVLPLLLLTSSFLAGSMFAGVPLGLLGWSASGQSLTSRLFSGSYETFSYPKNSNEAQAHRALDQALGQKYQQKSVLPSMPSMSSVGSSVGSMLSPGQMMPDWMQAMGGHGQQSQQQQGGGGGFGSTLSHLIPGMPSASTLGAGYGMAKMAKSATPDSVQEMLQYLAGMQGQQGQQGQGGQQQQQYMPAMKKPGMFSRLTSWIPFVGKKQTTEQDLYSQQSSTSNMFASLIPGHHKQKTEDEEQAERLKQLIDAAQRQAHQTL